MTRCFEETEIWQDIPVVNKGPLTTAHLMRWSAAIENWHKIHYDQAFTREHEKLPGLLVNGTLKQQFVMQALREWAGDSGWVWKVAFQFRAMNLVDEELTVWGRVRAKSPLPTFGIVQLDVGIRNANAVESTPGHAIVALPYRGGPAVPYPFVPPADIDVGGAL